MTSYHAKYDVLFVHVPKTAGTSMEHAPFIEGDGHMPFWAVPAECQRARFSFAFVRNPYDRFVSAVTEGMFTTLLQRNEHPKDNTDERIIFERAKQLVHFAAAQAPSSGQLELRSVGNWRVLGRGHDPLPHVEGWDFPIHYIPQHYFVSTIGLDRVGVEMLGRFEHLQRDWRRVCDRVGVPFELPHHRNAQRHRRRRYPAFYTPDVQDVVRRCYARDFEVLDYDADVLEDHRPDRGWNPAAGTVHQHGE